VRIGLASDTFGNLEPLATALDLFTRSAVDRVYFLGGRLADLDAVLAGRRAAPPEAAVPRSDAEFLAAVEGALARQVASRAHPLDGRIVRVPSRACAEYASGQVPRKQVDLVEGRICALVHDKAELTRDDIANATVIFHGNAPRAALVQIGARCFVTPGQLRAPAPGAAAATFAILEAGPAELVLTVFSAEGEELSQEKASLAAGAKLSVRG
jgi:hypothetical protein